MLQDTPLPRPFAPWLAVAISGIVVPACVLAGFALARGTALPTSVFGPLLAVSLMGAGMITAALARRLWAGVFLAVLTGTGLVIAAHSVGVPASHHALIIGLVVIIASISFAARGALFARSMADKGCWIAVFVVLGEAAVLVTAWARPEALPGWLLALLPAQWASAAIQTALSGSGSGSGSGTGTGVASAELLALGGTAAATLLVARLWPRRWPYLIMFSAWIGLSALVFHSPAATYRDGTSVAG